MFPELSDLKRRSFPLDGLIAASKSGRGIAGNGPALPFCTREQWRQGITWPVFLYGNRFFYGPVRPGYG